MPLLSAEQLDVVISTLLQATGASLEDARVVARHCVKANLAGHDSHGVIRVPDYIDNIKNGDTVPNADMEIERDTETTTVVNGNWGFGQVVSEKVMEITIDKASRNNVAAATVFRQAHVGRLTDYPVMAAEAGMISLMTADSGRGPKSVVPFGGREPRLGTNPLCIAMPSDLEGPFFMDFATSAVAGGKIAVAAARELSIPEGWIIDEMGNATTDPNALANGGAILPLGGPEGHIGYGLSAMVEIFSGILTGLGFGLEPSGRHNDGCFIAAFKVEAFRSLEEFKREVGDFARYLKSSLPASGFKEVYYPGELEFLTTQQRLKDGVFIEDKTWARLDALAKEYGLDDFMEFQQGVIK